MLGEFGPSGVAGQLGLTIEYELGDISGIAYLLGINAFLAAGQHRYQRAAWLFGASAPLWELDRVIKLALANADELPDAAVELKRIPPLEFN